MALTRDELETLHAANLERLVAELMAATRTGDIDALDTALDALVDFQAATPFPVLQLEAARARGAASAAIAGEALAELADVAEEVKVAGAGFKAAAKVAETGKVELLFPALAAASASGLELIRQFQTALDTVTASVDDVAELGDVPEAVQSLVDAFEHLKQEIDALS